jgi:phosphate uptake regulator
VRDREVNKLCLYLQREINKHASEDSIHGRTLFTYSYALEKLSDEIERLWRTAIKTSAKPPKSFLEISALISQLLELSFDLYYHPNLKTVGEIRNLREKIREDALKNLSSFQRIAHHLTKIAEEASDMNHLALIRLATVRKN